MKIWISLGRVKKKSGRKFSGKDGTGTRLSRYESDGDLKNETREEFKHKAKKRNKKLKKGDGNTAIPYGGTAQDPNEVRDVFIKKEIWLGRLDRDPSPKKHRLTLGGPKGKL